MQTPTSLRTLRAELQFRQFLAEHEYPGRVVGVGKSSDGKHAIQFSIITGRGFDSRNRKYVPGEAPGSVRTVQAHETSKSADLSNRIYDVMGEAEGVFVASNGEHTEALLHKPRSGSLEALAHHRFEDDGNNKTPRIWGKLLTTDLGLRYELGILRKDEFDGEDCEHGCERVVYDYQDVAAGFVHCIITYDRNGSPLPSYRSPTFIIPVAGTIGQVLSKLADNVCPRHFVCAAVKFVPIDLKGPSVVQIFNKYANSPPPPDQPRAAVA